MLALVVPLVMVCVAASPAPATDEWKVFPALAYNSDIGMQVGVFGTYSALAPDDVPADAASLPYHYSLTAQLAVSVLNDDGVFDLPVHDDFVNVDYRTLDGRWRLGGGAWLYQASNAGFYGLGNASPVVGSPSTSGRRATQYVRNEVAAQATAAYQLAPVARVGGGLLVERVSPTVYPGSTLDGDRGEPLLLGLSPFVTAIAAAAVELDTRDREIEPRQGLWIEASLRGAPATLGDDAVFGAAFGAATLHGRLYVPVWRDVVVLAARGFFDGSFGEPPLHELSRGGFAAVPLLGGSRGARGIPEGRYQGRVRTVASTEARVSLPPFDVVGEHFAAGVVGFVDAGRVWADWQPRRDLDGTDPFGMHPTVGGGLRLRWGDTVLIRLDVAWAPPPSTPDDDPIGVYFDLGNAF